MLQKTFARFFPIVVFSQAQGAESAVTTNILQILFRIPRDHFVPGTIYLKKNTANSGDQHRHWRALRPLRSVVPPTSRAIMLLCLAPCNSVLLSMIGIATTFMSVSALKAL